MTDDGLPWGYVHDVEGWLPLPKGPGLIHHGPPPFDVTLPDGRVRRVVHKPGTGGPDDAATPADDVPRDPDRTPAAGDPDAA
jgi:hypothetical protein